jgi:protein SCO1/2
MADPTGARYISRRRLLEWGVVCGVCTWSPVALREPERAGAQRATQHVAPSQAQAPRVSAHGGPVVPPVPLPDLVVTLAGGQAARLATLLAGKVTALQLIYTGCSSTCPIQGAIFERTQQLLKATPLPGAQMLSLSIDPLDDTPAQLQAWLRQFHAEPGWMAARPDPPDLSAIQSFLGNGRDGIGSLVAHATEVQIIDRRGALVWRTNELPAPESIVELMRRV